MIITDVPVLASDKQLPHRGIYALQRIAAQTTQNKTKHLDSGSNSEDKNASDERGQRRMARYVCAR